MEYKTTNIEGKRRKITRKSIDDEIEICEVQTSRNNIQCGIVKRILLKNVFCHEHLDIDKFIPQLNLLQGANGSGKSSVVAAIIVGLGGSCRATDRGQNVSSLIKNGKNTAVIEIHLSNDGINPYQKNKFGNTIIVERKLTSGGSSNYKIKSEQGAIISTKREDLNRILEKFNIQVDNPALILSQERAKTFLSTTNPKNLYKFFLTSTQLKQWSDNITDIRKDLHSQKLLISNKKESIKCLQKDLAETRDKVKAINSLEVTHRRVDHLEREKSWAEVQENEEKKSELQSLLSKLEKKLMKATESIENSIKELKELKSLKKANDDRVVTLSEQTKSLEIERIEAIKRIEEVKKILRKLIRDQNELQKEKLEREKDVAILRKKLDIDNNEAKANWEREMNQLKEENEKLKEDLEKIRLHIETEETQLHNVNESLSHVEKEFKHVEVQSKVISVQLANLKNECKSLKEQKDDSTIFGSYMPNLLHEIRNSLNGFQKPPIGPLGSYIKVKDRHKEWIHIVEKTLGTLLSGFLVFSYDDFLYLSKIFNRVLPRNTRRPRIIISKFRREVHDVRKYETGTNNFFSLWSIITTDNIMVANSLLDGCEVESILLIPSVEDAIDLLKDSKSVPPNCKKAMTLDGDTVFPDPGYKLYSGRPDDKRARFLQVSVADRIRDVEDNIYKTEMEVKKCQEEVRLKSLSCKQLKEEKQKSETKITEYLRKRNYCLRKVQELKNREIPPPPNVSQLQDDLQENITYIEDIERKMTEINNTIAITKNEVAEATVQFQEAQKRCEDINADVDKYRRSKEDTERKLHQKQNVINLNQDFVTKINNEIKEKATILKAKNESIEALIKDLEKNEWERIRVERSKEEIEKELRNLKSAIEKQQATFEDVDTLKETLRKKNENLTELCKEMRSQELYLDVMEKSIKGRSHALGLAKKAYKAIMIHSFKQYITKRKLKGSMEIDYKNETLKIMTTKDTGSKSQATQSLLMMSGGERSFATVSFVLALWDIVISPLRIMDEFDVFMDIVSRKQCIDMITESVKDYSQYIMVTPLECPIKSNKVRILRLDPPERNSTRVILESDEDE